MIFTPDKERDIIDKLTEENRELKVQIEELQNDLKTKELKEEIKEKEKLIKAPNIAKEINVEMEELVNNINEKLITIMDMIGEYND